MLWAFDMYEIPDEPIDVKEYDGLSGHSLMPFRIGLKPRHEKLQRFCRELRSEACAIPRRKDPLKKLG